MIGYYQRGRIRIALAAVIIGLTIGWFLPFWTGHAIRAEGIDGRLQACLNDE